MSLAAPASLVVAEPYAEQLTANDIAVDGTLSGRRVRATTGGVCIDDTGAMWSVDVGNGHCRRRTGPGTGTRTGRRRHC